MFVILGGLAMVGVGDLMASKKSAECFSANLTSRNLTSNDTHEYRMYLPIDVAGTFGLKITTDDENCADDNSAASGEFKGDMLIVGAQVKI